MKIQRLDAHGKNQPFYNFCREQVRCGYNKNVLKVLIQFYLQNYFTTALSPCLGPTERGKVDFVCFFLVYLYQTPSDVLYLYRTCTALVLLTYMHTCIQIYSTSTVIERYSTRILVRVYSTRERRMLPYPSGDLLMYCILLKRLRD